MHVMVLMTASCCCNQDVSIFELGPRFKGFNPSLAHHDGVDWVGVRLANNTYCGDYTYENQDTATYMSYIGLCQMNATTHVPMASTCARVEIDTARIVTAKGFVEHPIFRGIEDPRLFSYNGSLYISGTVMMLYQTTLKSNMEYTRVAIFRINKFRNGTDWGVYLYEDEAYPVCCCWNQPPRTSRAISQLHLPCSGFDRKTGCH
jgi:predicted GH43/DUF377 family glycosyl hydrolase